jgi:hypothetical protein
MGFSEISVFPLHSTEYSKRKTVAVFMSMSDGSDVKEIYTAFTAQKVRVLAFCLCQSDATEQPLFNQASEWRMHSGNNYAFSLSVLYLFAPGQAFAGCILARA